MTYEQVERERERLEARHEPSIRAALEEQGRDLVRALRAEDFPLSAFLDREPIEEATTAMWTDTLRRFVQLGASDVLALRREEDVPKDLWERIVRAFIASDGGTLIRAINRTTLDVTRETLQRGVAEGWGMARIADELEEAWPEVARYRAERIVRTEVMRASNHGSMEGARHIAGEYDLQLEKEWIATPGSGRTRDTHLAAHGQTVAMDEPFTVGGYPAMYPGDASLPPEESVNCRCTIGYIPVTKSWRERRNAEIRATYPALRDEWGAVQARDELAERHGLSERQVRRVLYEQA